MAHTNVDERMMPGRMCRGLAWILMISCAELRLQDGLHWFAWQTLPCQKTLCVQRLLEEIAALSHGRACAGVSAFFALSVAFTEQMS